MWVNLVSIKSVNALSSTFDLINKNTVMNKKLSPLLAISFDHLSCFLELTRWWTLCSWIVFLSCKITSKQITSMQLTMFFIQPVTWYPCRSSLLKEFKMFSKKSLENSVEKTSGGVLNSVIPLVILLKFYFKEDSFTAASSGLGKTFHKKICSQNTYGCVCFGRWFSCFLPSSFWRTDIWRIRRFPHVHDFRHLLIYVMLALFCDYQRCRCHMLSQRNV